MTNLKKIETYVLGSILGDSIADIVNELTKKGQDLNQCFIDKELDYDDNYRIYVRGVRLETEEEAKKREVREAKLTEEASAREAREYARLKAKFEKP